MSQQPQQSGSAFLLLLVGLGCLLAYAQTELPPPSPVSPVSPTPEPQEPSEPAADDHIVEPNKMVAAWPQYVLVLVADDSRESKAVEALMPREGEYYALVRTLHQSKHAELIAQLPPLPDSLPAAYVGIAKEQFAKVDWGKGQAVTSETFPEFLRSQK